MRITLITLLSLLIAPSAFAAASALSKSFNKTANSSTYRAVQLIRCNEGTAAADANSLTGEQCEAGDWSRKSLDCTGMATVTVKYIEYGTSSTAKVWSCLRRDGDLTAGGTEPGEEDPSGTPTAADPDPLCIELSAVAGVTLSGTTGTSQGFTLPGGYDYLVGEIDAASSSDSTLFVSCSR